MKKRALTFILLLPAILSLLVFGAHFLRSGNLLFTTCCVLLVFGLFVRKQWAARLVQVALLFATVEWIHTAVVLASARSAAGEPWTRMAIILTVVAAVSLISVFVFRTETLRDRYLLGQSTAPSDEGVNHEP